VGLEPAFVFGGGGHGRVLLDVIERQGKYRVAEVLDDALPADSVVRDVRVSGGRERLAELVDGGVQVGVIAIGDNETRERLAELASQAGLRFLKAVDPSGDIASGVTVGDGTFVARGVIVNVGCTVGSHAILNTACTVDHDSEVGAFAHLSPGVHVSGGCVIGARSHVGIGASVAQGLTIGDGATVGAGSVVLGDVPVGATVVGVPAGPLR
jgi:acetyltransferase EpsM